MEMEKLESALYNWPLAPYDNKLEVDANYKRMLHYGMQPENIKAVNLGVASHNLFELAYAATLAETKGVEEFITLKCLKAWPIMYAGPCRRPPEIYCSMHRLRQKMSSLTALPI